MVIGAILFIMGSAGLVTGFFSEDWLLAGLGIVVGGLGAFIAVFK
jgi:hypothetical protein